MSPERWPLEVSLTSFQVMSQLAQFSTKFTKPHNKETSMLLVSTLLKFIEFEMAAGPTKTQPSEELLSSAFNTICIWLMEGQWILKNTCKQTKHFILLFYLFIY